MPFFRFAFFCCRLLLFFVASLTRPFCMYFLFWSGLSVVCARNASVCIWIHRVCDSRLYVVFAIRFMRSDLKMSNMVPIHGCSICARFVCPFKFHMVHRKTCVAGSHMEMFSFYFRIHWFNSAAATLRLRAYLPNFVDCECSRIVLDCSNIEKK